MIKNNGPILSSHVRSLPVECGWVVIRPKNVEQLLIIDLGRVEFNLYDLRMPRFVVADILITGIFFGPTGVTDRRCDDAFQISECLLNSPKAAGTEGGFFSLHYA